MGNVSCGKCFMWGILLVEKFTCGEFNMWRILLVENLIRGEFNMWGIDCGELTVENWVWRIVTVDNCNCGEL